MVFPVVLAVGALALYFLTKPKKSDSDIYGKDSEPKTVQKEESKKELDNKLYFHTKNSDGYIMIFRNYKSSIGESRIKIGMIDNSKVKPTYSMFNTFTKQVNQKPYTTGEENQVKEKIESIIKNHEDQKLKNKSTRKEKSNEENKTKRKLTNKELKEKLDKVLQFKKKSNQFQKDGKYAYFQMGRLDSSSWFRFGNITKSGNVIFYDYENQEENKKVGKVISSIQTDDKISWKISLRFSGFSYFLSLD